MTGDQQFMLSLLWMSVNTLFAVLAWLKSEKSRAQAQVAQEQAKETYHMVNSRVDEFKTLLLKASELSIAEFKKDLQAAALKQNKDANPQQGEMDRKR